MTKAHLNILAFLLLISGYPLQAQDIRFGVYGGYGSYSLGDLKALQDETGGNPLLPVLSETASFPGYLTYTGFLASTMKDSSELVFDISYQFTGARSFYGDYSGSYRLSMQLKGLRSGLQYRIPIINGGKWGSHFAVGGGVTSGRLDLTESLEITAMEAQQEDITFVSLNFFGEAALAAYYRLTSRINLETLFGYEYNVPGRLKWSENKKAYLQDDDSKPVRVDWSGVRFRIGASYRISPK